MKATLQLALEALGIVKIHYTQNRHVNEAITAIKEALAQPEQEPVAWMNDEMDCIFFDAERPEPFAFDFWKPLYTTPPQRTAAEGEDTRRAWVGLSREDCYQVRERESDAFMYGVAWAEAKLKEKNTDA